jgi:hypothetical protein
MDQTIRINVYSVSELMVVALEDESMRWDALTWEPSELAVSSVFDQTN